MTHWLKVRLSALMGGAILMGSAYLHAQPNYGPPSKTPEEAAANFYHLMELYRPPLRTQSRNLDESAIARLVGSIEHAQFDALHQTSGGGGEVIRFLAGEAVAVEFAPRVQSSNASQTIVAMTPNASAQPREVVVVPEDGGFRVDIVATYGRWHNLSGLDADKALYRETEFVSPALTTVPGFLGAATLTPCFSNMRLLGLGMGLYALDYDERLPPARKWASRNVLFPYVKEEKLFKCPALSTKGSGYAFNSKLSQLPMTHIHSALQTIQLYETSNPTLGAFAPFTGRAYRHARNEKEGMNICFADGHVKWFAKGTNAQHTTIDPADNIFGFVTISTRR